MAIFTSQTDAFLALMRAGLWGGQSTVQEFKSLKVQDYVDWEKVYQLAQEQSVLGIVLQGIEELRVKGVELSVPKILLLQWIGEVQMIEQRNKDMNAFVADLIEKLRKNDIYAILVKGQGIAQCYERPLWRASGDVDLLLSDENYKKAVPILSALSTSIDEENAYNKHLAMAIGPWEVEIHGTLRGGLWKRVDKELDEIQNKVFNDGYVRPWMNEHPQISLLRADEDIVYVFTHILQHFFKGGIGLRQICDWSRLLWTFRGEINNGLLKSRLKRAGIMSEWKVFSALAVDYLGMSKDVIPFYSSKKCWSKKSRRVLEFILETGNFGHNIDFSYYSKQSLIARKTISLLRHTKDAITYLFIFPIDAIKVWGKMINVGIKELVK